LKELEADHVLARTDYKEVPPRVDYALTPLGRSLADAIVPLCNWGTAALVQRETMQSSAAPKSYKNRDRLLLLCLVAYYA
jgi:DNA-binding HxlR family transcriptional regulator